jgi:hypothetical protein
VRFNSSSTATSLESAGRRVASRVSGLPSMIPLAFRSCL